MKKLDGEVFKVEMDKIVADFGDAKFNPSRIGFIYEICSTLNESQFKRVVNNLRKTSKFPPLPTDFEEASKNYIAHNRQLEKQREIETNREMLSNEQLKAFAEGLSLAMSVPGKKLKSSGPVFCKHCDDTGYVKAEAKNINDGIAPKLFNCFCAKNNNDSRFEDWNQDQLKNYTNINVRREA